MLSALFGLSKRATIENPSVSLHDTDAWNAMFGGELKTESGIKVTKRKALSVDAVWAAVSLISGACARLPMNRYSRTANDGREVDRTHPTHKLVRRKPNSEMDAFQFWQLVYVHKLLWGRAYVWLDQRSPGEPVEMFPLLPDRTAPERLNGKQVFDQTQNKKLARELDGQLVYVTEVGGKTRTFFPEEILDIRGMAIDSVETLDLVDYAKEAIGLAIAQRKFGAKFFKSGARMGGVLELPAALKKEAQDRVESGFRRTYEDSDQWFKTIVLRDNAKFHQAAFNPQDSQLVEASEAQSISVARFFKLQPSKLGIQKATSYNSKSEDNQAFLDDTLADHLAAVEYQCNDKLLTEDEKNSDSVFFEINRSSLLQMDQTKRYGAYEIGLRSRFLTRNEVRKFENLNAVEGGDEFDNFGATGAVAAPSVGQNPPNPPSDPEKKRDLSLILTDLAARARHKTKSISAFDGWINGEMPDFRGRFEASGVGFEVLGTVVDRLKTARNGAESVQKLQEQVENEVQTWNADSFLTD